MAHLLVQSHPCRIPVNEQKQWTFLHDILRALSVVLFRSVLMTGTIRESIYVGRMQLEIVRFRGNSSCDPKCRVRIGLTRTHPAITSRSRVSLVRLGFSLKFSGAFCQVVELRVFRESTEIPKAIWRSTEILVAAWQLKLESE